MPLQAGDGRGRQRGEVGRIDGAPVALGQDVEGDRCRHARAEQVAEPACADCFVAVVAGRGSVGRTAVGAEQVPDVVEKRCRDEFVGRTRSRRQGAALRGVAQLVHLLAVVTVPAFSEELQHLCHRIAHGRLPSFDGSDRTGVGDGGGVAAARKPRSVHVGCVGGTSFLVYK